MLVWCYYLLNLSNYFNVILMWPVEPQVNPRLNLWTFDPLPWPGQPPVLFLIPWIYPLKLAHGILDFGYAKSIKDMKLVVCHIAPPNSSIRFIKFFGMHLSRWHVTLLISSKVQTCYSSFKNIVTLFLNSLPSFINWLLLGNIDEGTF